MKKHVRLLFPTVLYESEINLSDNDLNSLKSEEFYRNADNNGWATKTDIHKSYKSLMHEIDSHVDFYCKNVLRMSQETTLSCCGSWINKHDIGDFAHNHYHPNSMISGILYLDIPQKSGDTIFSSHTINMFGRFFNPVFEEENKYNSCFQSINVKNNMLLIFPSILQHSVPISESQKPRYTFAFDYIPTGKIITHTNKITITV